LKRPLGSLIVATLAALGPFPPAALAVSPAVLSRVSASVVQVQAGADLGTAFALGSPGYYLTNAHVVTDQRSVVVTDLHGDSRLATVVVLDPRDDLAELHSSLRLPPLAVSHTAPQAGEAVATVGSPQGLVGTVTVGNIGAVSRLVDDPYAGRTLDMIQLAMAVNHGNSGGPLLDGRGRVLGVITLGSNSAEDVQAIGFALPVATALAALKDRGRRAEGSPLKTGGSSTPSMAAIGAAASFLLALGVVLWRRVRSSRRTKPVVTAAYRPAANVRLRRRPAQPDELNVSLRSRRRAS
jgi:LPXTG-motif cell wall-anchored protein